MAPFTFYKIVEKKMESVYEMKKIAVMHSDFKEKFGIPRQSGLVEELESYIVFEPEYRNPDALRGLEGFSHIWILWLFSKNRRDHFSPTVRPPRLGGNKRMGVFATRSSFRPNSIAMSSVEICGIQYHTDRGPVIRVKGADLLDGTPILDIKPYIPAVDSHPDAREGFAAVNKEYELTVEVPERWQKVVEPEKYRPLLGVLAQDPRPAYKEDEEREYGMMFASYEVKFIVKVHTLTVTQIEKIK